MANIKLTANEKAFVTSMDNAAGAVGRLSAELNIKLARAMKEADSIANNFQKGFGKLGEKISSVGQSLTSALTVPLGIASGFSLKLYGDIDQLKRGLDAYGISLAEIKKTAKLPGLGIEEAAKSTITFASVKFAADVSSKAVREFGNALIYSGRGKEELAGIATAFAQMKGKGNVMAQEINQIAERLPMIRDLMQQAFGTSDTEVLQKKGISADQFLEKIVQQMEKLPRVSGGFKTAMENAFDSLKIGAYEAVNVADKLFNLTGIMNSLSGYIDAAVDKFKQLSPEMQTAIFVIGGIALAIGPVLTVIGFLTTTIIPAFLIGLATLSAPILGIALVVAIVVANIIRYWDNIKSVLVDSGIWDGVAAIFKAGLGYLNNIVGVFYSLFTADWEGFWKNLKTIVARLWNTLVEIIVIPFKALFEFQRLAANAFGLTSLSNGATTVLGWIDSIAENVKAKIPESTNYLKKFADAMDKITTKPPKTTGKGNGDAVISPKNLLGGLDIIESFKGKNDLSEAFKYGLDIESFKKFLAEKQKELNAQLDPFLLDPFAEIVKAGERLKKGLPNIMSNVGTDTESAFRKDVLEKMKKAFSDFGNLDTSAMLALPALIAQQVNFSVAGAKIDSEIKKNLDIQAKIDEINKTAEMSTFLTQQVEGAIEGVAQAVGEGGGLKNVFSKIMGIVGDFMIQLGKKLFTINTIITDALNSIGGPTGIAISLGLIVAGAALKSQSFQGPKFAQGGMVMGETLAVLGDNRSGREMALPWEKTGVFAQAIAANISGGVGGGGEVKFKLMGEDLHGAVEQYKKKRGIR